MHDLMYSSERRFIKTRIHRNNTELLLNTDSLVVGMLTSFNGSLCLLFFFSVLL